MRAKLMNCEEDYEEHTVSKEPAKDRKDRARPNKTLTGQAPVRGTTQSVQKCVGKVRIDE